MVTQHGRHRRRRNRTIVVLVVSGLVLLGGGAVALALRVGGSHPAGTAHVAARSTSAPGPTGGTTAAASTGALPSQSPSPVQPAASLASPQAGAVIRVGGTPQYAQVAPDGTFVYVTDPAAGTVLRVDTRSDKVTATIRVPQGPPQLLSFSPDGRRAFVSVFDRQYRANYVVYIDTSTDTVTKAVAVDPGPYAVSPSPDGRTLYVPLYLQAHLDVVDIASGRMVRRIPAPPNPHWLAYSPDGGFGYVTDHFSDVVSVLDLAADRIVATIPAGDGPHALAMSPDGRRIAGWTTSGTRPRSSTSIRGRSSPRCVPSGRQPQHVSYAPDGRHFYTANSKDGTVSVVDTATYTVSARVPTGAGPTSVAVLPDGRKAYMRLDDGTLRVLTTG